MAALIVNLVLIVAVLVLIGVWAFTGARRRRQDRHRQTLERTLILQAFTGAAPASAATPAAAPGRDPGTSTVPAAGPRQLDPASVAALLDLLEGRRPQRRGLLASLVTSPRSIWSAGENAGQQIGRRAMGEELGGDGAQLHRAAAAELVDIHAHDPDDAQREYARYAAALGDPALAELYVRAAAYNAYTGHDQVRQIIEAITGSTPLPEVSDGHASIAS
jgi:hypothetical protein